MRAVPKIAGSNMGQFNLALYVSFQQAILMWMDSIAMPSKVLRTEERKEQYAQLVDKLTDKNSDQRARIGTAEQANDDAERDRLVSQLFFVVTERTSLDERDCPQGGGASGNCDSSVQERSEAGIFGGDRQHPRVNPRP